MASASVKLGVEYAQFKRGMNEAQESVKTLTTALKANESQLGLTGDKELYLKNKVQLLKDQIDAQKQVVANATKALSDMKNRGIQPASKEYQTMQRNVYNAVDKLNKMQTSLKEVETGAEGAKTGAEQMNTEMKKVGTGVSWQNLTEGLDSIISKLESGARAAVSFGKKVVSAAKDSTGWADELLTLSQQTGIDVTRLQQMQKVAEFIDTDVDAIITAKNRMAKATQTQGGVTALEDVLGISLDGQSADDLFWEIGDALVHMGEGFDKEKAAQDVFGRSWHELLPLFKAGREEYERMLSEQSALSEEDVRKLGQADDAIKTIEQEWQQMKNQFWADNADKITELMSWLIDNKDAVVATLTAIAAGFGALKLGSLAADLGKTVDALKGLGLIKGGGDAAKAVTAAAGGSGGGGGALTGILGGAKALMADIAPVLGSEAAVIAAAVMPAVLAQNADYAHAEEKRARRAAVAATYSSVDAEFLNRAADLVTLRGGQNMDFGGINDLLMGMKDRSDLQKMQLHNMLNGSFTASGYNTWNELQRIWGGEDLEQGRLNDTLEAVTAAYEKMLTVSDESNAEQTRNSEAVATAVTGMAQSLPGDIATAIANGMASVKIVIGAGAVDTIGKHVGNSMANQVMALAGP